VSNSKAELLSINALYSIINTQSQLISDIMAVPIA